MIYVTLGTHHQPFARALELVADSVTDLPEEIVVQHGETPPLGRLNAVWYPYLSYDLACHCLRTARVVITHAGVGSIMSARSCGHLPIVVPRRRDFGEHVDDHQLQIADRLATDGAVIWIEDILALRNAIVESPRRDGVESATPTNLGQAIADIANGLRCSKAEKQAPLE